MPRPTRRKQDRGTQRAFQMTKQYIATDAGVEGVGILRLLTRNLCHEQDARTVTHTIVPSRADCRDVTAEGYECRGSCLAEPTQ